ncbi:MAG: 1-acyl-sn-glycerol-3-phosphate acyltransferase [Bacteroidetes bacterium]|nr:1-acyl-sn-glycerol-3-phosphate acyltransferase [Bacteroidota bacterium]
MNWYKEILGRIWALWALITFVISFLIILLPSLLTGVFPDPRGQDYFIKIARIWIRVWLFIIGCRLIVKGKTHFEKGKAVIIACNHNSLLDPPLTSPFIIGPNKTIAKSSFTKVPLFGWYYKRGGVIVNRKNNDSRRKSYEQMKQVLQAGMHMCVYPEGTRNRTTAPLKAFYNGAFKLSVDTNHAIMPALLFNTKKVLPPGKFLYGWPGKMEIHFLPPIAASGLSPDQLKELVFSTMSEYYLQHST